MPTSVDSLKEKAYTTLREKILMGNLPPGSRLSEFSAARELGISRAPVREAISRLASESIVEQIPGFGAFIKAPETRELHEMYEFREALEGFVASMAAPRIQANQLQRLVECCTAQDQILRRLAKNKAADLDDKMATEWTKIDFEFHSTILAAAGNHWIERHLTDSFFLSRIWGQRLDARIWDIHSALSQSLREHRAIAAALRKGDPKAARLAMSRHIGSTREKFVKQMESLGSSSPTWPATESYRRLSALQSKLKAAKTTPRANGHLHQRR